MRLGLCEKAGALACLPDLLATPAGLLQRRAMSICVVHGHEASLLSLSVQPPPLPCSPCAGMGRARRSPGGIGETGTRSGMCAAKGQCSHGWVVLGLQQHEP